MTDHCKNCEKNFKVEKEIIISGGDYSTYFTTCPYCNFGTKLSYEDVVKAFGKITVANPPLHSIECVCSYCKDHFFATPEEVSKKGMTYFANCKKCGFCNALPVKETEELLKSIKVNTSPIIQQIFEQFNKKALLIVTTDKENNIQVSPSRNMCETTFWACTYTVLDMLKVRFHLIQTENIKNAEIFIIKKSSDEPVICTITCKYS